MSASEKELDQIFGQGTWEAPNLLDLRNAFNTLDSTMKALSESPGWGGASADAAAQKWRTLQKKFGLIADSVDEVRSLITKGNAALARAQEAVDGAPAVVVSKDLRLAAAAADVGAEIWVPALGKFKPASTAVSLVESFLGNKRAAAADAAKATLETELAALAGDLDRVGYGRGNRFIDVPEPQKPTPIPQHSIGGGTPPPPTPGYRTGGGNPPPPNPSYTGPSYPTPSYTGPSYPGGSPSTPIIGDPYPYNPRYPSPSIDDGSVGTIPGGPGVTDPRFGGGNDPRYGVGGSGSGSGVNGAVFGGATAAGAATLRFGTGGGFGGGGMGGGGLGAGGAGGSGGLLGSGKGGVGGAGTTSSGAGAGAGSGAAGSGAGAAGAGNRGGMMGGQQMGGGGQGGKKEKRAGLGGPIAPKLEDDEVEFVPLPDGARAGGRDGVLGDGS